MNIALVTIGEYDSYHILAAFSEDQRAAAYAFAGLVGGEVEEFALNPAVPDDPGLDCYSVEIRRSGEAMTVSVPRLDSDGNRRETCAWFRTHLDEPWARKNHWKISGYCYTADERSARRCFEELRRQILAGQRPSDVDMGKN